MILIAISCAWVLGMVLGAEYNLPLTLIFSGLLPITLVFFFRQYRKLCILTAVCLAVFFGAAFYYPGTVPEESPVAAHNNQGIFEIQGAVSAEPEVRDNVTHLEIATSKIKIDGRWQKTQGTILIFIPRYPDYRYGDILALKGKLEIPPQFESFDYQAYLARQGIFSTMLSPQVELMQTDSGNKLLAWIYSLRDNLSQSMAASLPEPQASLGQGIVLGVRSTIPDALKTNLSVTGTAQLLAISGINLSIIAGILIALGIRLFGRRYYIYVWLAMVIIWFYVLLTGMQAPVIRSAIMATVFLFAELLGRQKNVFAALAFSAALMVGITPQVLWDVSFQLSFIAMMGLIFIAPPIRNLGEKVIYSRFGKEGIGVQIATFIIESFSVSLGAIIAVWPVVAYNFGLFSVIAPLSNFVISPALPAIILSGALTAFLGLVSLPAAQIIGWTAWVPISYMLWLVNAFAVLPWSSINITTVHESLVWMYYLILGLAIWFNSNFKKLANVVPGFFGGFKSGANKAFEVFSATPKKWIIIPLVLLACLSSLTAVTLPDNNLHVSMLDVGEGDAVLLQIGNRNILIDGGPSPQAVCIGLSNKLSFWNKNIDMVILTHPHLDHLSGLIEVLKRYKVKQVLAPNLTSDSPAYQEWRNLINNREIAYTEAVSGLQINLGSGTVLDVLNPSGNSFGAINVDLENNGLVLRLSRDKISFLFTADISQEAESRLVTQRADIVSNVLKVAHHGSSTSTSSDFLSVVKPQIAVISVGADNTFGHPAADTITRIMKAVGSENNIYRTDKSGTVEFITNGQQLWIKTNR